MSYDPEEDRRELEAVMARLPRRTPAEVFAEIEAARRAERNAPWPEPSIVPTSEFPAFGVIRYPCPLGCGWHHQEEPGVDAYGPIVVAAPYDSQAVSAALTASANERGELFRERVEAALVDHYETAHPGR
ncbi:hypothetical protein ABTX60_07410 [Streptomyces sp. NPDC126510]|uniref:hypothetical protein n=1 Tax=Streptomyces sp. NPDC126510 TaxID=3155317 RepID=UPI00331D5316